MSKRIRSSVGIEEDSGCSGVGSPKRWDDHVADGYVLAGDSVSGEGIHYANFALIDGNFEVDRPESLIYTVGPNGRLRLAGVEYLVLKEFSAGPPEGFTGDEDIWRDDTEGLQAWELNVWLWLKNPD